MGAYCAPLISDLFLFCYERDFMMSLSDDKQADIMDALNTTSRYLDGILNIKNAYFDTMVSQIYLSELQLNKAYTFTQILSSTWSSVDVVSMAANVLACQSRVAVT